MDEDEIDEDEGEAARVPAAGGLYPFALFARGWERRRPSLATGWEFDFGVHPTSRSS